MSEMVERGAKAILEAIGYQSGCYSDRCCCSGAAAVLECNLGVTEDDLARAVIEAMREPTASMIDAVDLSSGESSEDTIVGAWKAMIDAALKD